MGRTEKASKNSVAALAFYFLNSIFGFITRTVVINFLGIQYSGLNSLFSNVVGMLNVAELGLATAVGYSLYKPLARSDTKKINEIMRLYKKFYRIIAGFIAVVGLIVTLFLPYMVNTDIDMTEIRVAYVLYLSSTVVSYLFTYLNVLPIADQKNYIVSVVQGVLKIAKNVVQLY